MICGAGRAGDASLAYRCAIGSSVDLCFPRCVHVTFVLKVLPRTKVNYEMVLHRKERKIIYDVYGFMKREADNNVVDNLKHCMKRTAAATKCSVATFPCVTPFLDRWPTKGIKKSLSKGNRLVIVHAGGEASFVSNAFLTFKTGAKSDDYYDNMNLENYERWLRTKLIPNLPPNSVVVVDNASYHNKQLDAAPTSTTKKANMQTWLRQKFNLKNPC
ncbi:hypothetical protein EVAR_20808_1 [Eumeta japonica]|uniref:Tc1-like transposase DDE domain-containing protein n=1 Tax=Eumeta variegata TaxID=151549 RepID=A0A4C1UEX5_EUMVA|nr:hypothetical protein EVAR_20808_1 [Eumeta japonica]